MSEACRGACQDCPTTTYLEQDRLRYAQDFPNANLGLFDMAGTLIQAILEEGNCAGAIKYATGWLPSSKCGNQFADQANTVLNALHMPLAHASVERSAGE